VDDEAEEEEEEVLIVVTVDAVVSSEGRRAGTRDAPDNARIIAVYCFCWRIQLRLADTVQLQDASMMRGY